MGLCLSVCLSVWVINAAHSTGHAVQKSPPSFSHHVACVHLKIAQRFFDRDMKTPFWGKKVTFWLQLKRGHACFVRSDRRSGLMYTAQWRCCNVCLKCLQFRNNFSVVVFVVGYLNGTRKNKRRISGAIQMAYILESCLNVTRCQKWSASNSVHSWHPNLVYEINKRWHPNVMLQVC